MKCPKLIVTCPHGKEERAIEEIMDILISRDLNVQCCVTRFPGVLMVFTSMDSLEAAKLLYTKPSSFIFRITPVFECVEADLKKIVEVCLKLAKQYMKPNCKFHVDCTRRGRRVSSSLEVERKVGEAIIQSLNCIVDFKNPDFIVKVEIVGDIAGISILKHFELFKKKAKPR